MPDPKPDMVFLVTGEPDGYNRRHFWAFWPAYVGALQYHWGVRGQYFHAELQPYIDREMINGKWRVKKVLYLKDLAGMTEEAAIHHCEELVRTENPA